MLFYVSVGHSQNMAFVQIKCTNCLAPTKNENPAFINVPKPNMDMYVEENEERDGASLLRVINSELY